MKHRFLPSLLIFLLALVLGSSTSFRVPIAGSWSAKWANDLLCIVLSRQGAPRETRCYRKEDLSRWDADTGFVIVRDQGILRFEGSLGKNRGKGTFSFEANSAFRSYLKKHGYANVPDELILALYQAKIDRDFLDYLFVEHSRAKPLNLDALATSGLTRSGLQQQQQVFEELGYKELSVSDHIQISREGLRKQMVVGLQRRGYRNVPIDHLLEVKNAGVKLDYIESVLETGLKVSAVRDFAWLHKAGVDVPFIEQVVGRAGEEVTSDEVLRRWRAK